MKIAYVTTYDAWNSSNWNEYQTGLSGAGYYLAKSLEKIGANLSYIGPIAKTGAILTRSKWEFYRRILKQDYYRWAEPLVWQNYAKEIARKIDNADIVLCPENAVPIARLNCQQPLVLWTDAAIGNLIGFYDYLNNLCAETRQNIDIMEKSAFDRCDRLVFTSDWAANNAIERYNLNPGRVSVIPWGANIECDRTETDIEAAIASRKSDTCKLLFVGVEWHRKGGDVALEVARQLNNRGIPTELIAIGSRPDLDSVPAFANAIGFVDKATDIGRKTFDRLLGESHFLILPSRAETYGHVLCEANSFGVPVLATDVGGVGTIVRDDINGKLFSSEAAIADYCEYISHRVQNYSTYRDLARSSFQEYRSRLNWDVAARSILEVLEQQLL